MVSVIIPAYNAENTIVQTLDSVFAQTYYPIEIIVINDGSTDTTASVVSNYKEEVKLITIANKGVSHARNLGLSYANGKYIQFLDSDDILMPEKLSLQVKALEDNDADVAYGNWQRFVQEKEKIIIKETVTKQLGGNIEVALFTDFWCPPAALLYSKKIVDKIGGWKEWLPVIQDARYMLDAALKKGKFIYTSGIMALYRTDQQQSLSQRNETAFIKDCFENTADLYELWKGEFDLDPDKKQAIISSLRFCANRLSVLDYNLAKKPIHLIKMIDPNYIPNEKGMLRTLSMIFGYATAEKIATLKRKYL